MTTKEFLNDVKITGDLLVTGSAGVGSISSINTTTQLTLTSSQASSTAIHIDASGIAGGIDIDSGKHW